MPRRRRAAALHGASRTALRASRCTPYASASQLNRWPGCGAGNVIPLGQPGPPPNQHLALGFPSPVCPEGVIQPRSSAVRRVLYPCLGISVLKPAQSISAIGLVLTVLGAESACENAVGIAPKGRDWIPCNRLASACAFQRQIVWRSSGRSSGWAGCYRGAKAGSAEFGFQTLRLVPLENRKAADLRNKSVLPGPRLYLPFPRL
jgi:hypothetical protein